VISLTTEPTAIIKNALRKECASREDYFKVTRRLMLSFGETVSSQMALAEGPHHLGAQLGDLRGLGG
jgi:hypothetical protein